MEKDIKYYDQIPVEPFSIRDVVLVRKYGDNLIKIHQINSYPNPKANAKHRETILIDGFEFWTDEICVLPDGSFSLVKDFSAKGTVNNIKLLNNLTRAKNRILEYGLCNDWEYFSTFTIDRQKFNRYDLSAYHKSFSQWLRDYNKKYGLHIKYLTVPEKHKDGAWHEHGFIMGIPKSHLREFTLKEKIPKHIRDKLKEGCHVFDFPAYREKFGFCDFEPIRSREGASYYILKYITKDLQRSVSKLNARMFYNSQGLKSSEVVAMGDYQGTVVWDYQNEWCKCGTFAYSEELLKYIVSKVQDKNGWLKKDE